jgi:hypothetical protein
VDFALLRRLCFLSFKHRELVWGSKVSGCLREAVIMVVEPRFDDLARFGKTEEQVLIQAFVSQPALIEVI